MMQEPAATVTAIFTLPTEIVCGSRRKRPRAAATQNPAKERTSAVAGMSIRDQRCKTRMMRERFESATDSDPFLVSAPLPGTTMSNEQFALAYLLGHLQKRDIKTVTTRERKEKTKKPRVE